MNLLGLDRVPPTGGEPPQEVCALVQPPPVQRKFAAPTTLKHKGVHGTASGPSDEVVDRRTRHRGAFHSRVAGDIGTAVLNQERLPGDK